MSASALDVIAGRFNYAIDCGDCLALLPQLPEASVDLVLGSPPYMDARTYQDGTSAANLQRGCREWVDWMLDVTEAAVRVSKGLVLWVVSGVQRDLVYWPGCEGLAWLWWERGNHLWRPCIWLKTDQDGGGTGIPGSGGAQWLRNDWEYILAFKREGWLPWADNTAMGHKPVYGRVGGEMSNRTIDGQRANARVGKGIKERRDPWDKHGRGNNLGGRNVDGSKKCGTNRRANGKRKNTVPQVGANGQDGEQRATEGRPMPKIANPGNVIRARVGGGHMGNRLCHENEAPFPEALAEFFIRSYVPPGGIVLDPFSGSGTTAAVALAHNRRAIGFDLRQSQVDLALRRIDGVTPQTLFPEQP